MTNNTGPADGHGNKVINGNVNINDSSRNNEINKSDIQNNQNNISLQIDHNKVTNKYIATRVRTRPNKSGGVHKEF